ncbi:MAG TPA: protein kinase [Polyangiales bacterium]|nr:protein kinase [Polyangiales bacterium]
MTEPVVDAALSERRIANRYVLHEALGQGGMACVYRATDLSNGREVALKQLCLPDDVTHRAALAALFEREYHTLAQLQHPRVISVFDYGVVPGEGPYYTMELLDGGDLRDRAPLPWREVCSYAFDVCSSLALLHSRRLLHRDVSPRNIRCTHDGRAKLIDFGAMAPMGAGSGAIVGTPAFTPPEALSRSVLDARADLFSLGASLYFALTGTVPYPAHNFRDLFAAWNTRPAAPSQRVSDIPAELDDLVLSLLSVEPSLRPLSAFEVMQRLAAIAGLRCDEAESVSRAYLVTPLLVARDDTLAALRGELEAARSRRGSGVLIRAASGLGRTRVLDAIARDAKVLGATVVRASANASHDPFAVVFALLQHMVDTLPSLDIARRYPSLFEIAQSSSRFGDEPAMPRLRSPEQLRACDSAELQRTICRFLLAYSRRQPLLIAVDDIHRIDEASAAVLAALLDRIQRGRLLIVLTALCDREGLGLDVLARRCNELPLEPLTRFETRELLTSVFGEVPNLEMLTGEIYTLARGNPRHSMDLAQHLVDRRAITYAAGTWTLPSALSTSDLPSSVEEAIQARVARLSPHARFLAEAQALAFTDVFAHEDYRALCPEVDASRIEAAIAELLSAQALVSYGRTYALANRIWSDVLIARLRPNESVRHHRALAELYKPNSNVAWIHHLFAADLEQEGLQAVQARQRIAATSDGKLAVQSNVGRLAPVYFRSIELAIRFGRSRREVHDLRRWAVTVSIVADDSYYWDVAPAWLEQLKRDSGLLAWQALHDEPDPRQRLTRALTQTHERWQATAEADRVCSVQEGIRQLAEYVVVSIVIGGRSMNADLLETLPALLEPFAPLSPLLEALYENTLATVETTCRCQLERAVVRWVEVHEKLGRVQVAEMQHVWAIRNAIAYGLGMIEAANGSAAALRWAEYLDQDPQQRVSALYLRKVVRLQQGDWQGAEQYARQAELTALQSSTQQMFHYMLPIELEAHAHARDLAGVKDVIDRLQPLASKYPGWMPYLRQAEAQFDLIRGDYLAAETGFEQCIEVINTSGQRTLSRAVLISAHVGWAEALLALNRPEEARRRAGAMLARCQELEVEQLSFALVRVLALAEARLGEFASAAARLHQLIDRQLALGVSGLRLGMSYEARAQTAIWANDKAVFEYYARLTAREYRHGARSPLGARYESLINEARRRGFTARAELRDFTSSDELLTHPTHVHEIHSVVQAALTDSDRPEDRSKKALQLVCDASGSRGGHLYLVKEPETVTLAASYLSPAPPPGLEEFVQDQLQRDRDRSESSTAMVTTVVNEANSGYSVTLAGTVYELVLLRAPVGNAAQVAGVAAIVSGESRARHPQRQQLLAAVAAQLARR